MKLGRLLFGPVKLKHLLYGSVISLGSMVAGCMTTYTVDETEQAVVKTFGDPVKVVIGATSGVDDGRYERFIKWNKKQENPVDSVSSGAGLRFKWPWQTVDFIEDRLMSYDSSPSETTTKDKKKIVIDYYAPWQIDNPLQFVRTLKTEGVALARLEDLVFSAIRTEVGKANMIEVIRNSNKPLQTTEERLVENIDRGRVKIMQDVTYDVNEKAFADYGVGVPDVRIMRAELPPENLESIYRRMVQERSRIAKGFRSEGKEQATKTRADTDREVVSLETDAYREAEGIRGEGDAIATEKYNKAYSEDPAFFEFWRTLEAYKKAFDPQHGKTKIILNADKDDFLKYLRGALENQPKK